LVQKLAKHVLFYIVGNEIFNLPHWLICSSLIGRWLRCVIGGMNGGLGGGLLVVELLLEPGRKWVVGADYDTRAGLHHDCCAVRVGGAAIGLVTSTGHHVGGHRHAARRTVHRLVGCVWHRRQLVGLHPTPVGDHLQEAVVVVLVALHHDVQLLAGG